MFTMFRDLKPEARFVAFLASCIFGLFAVVAITSMFLPVHADADIKQTVIALVMLAAGFYLGSTASSKNKDDTIAAIASTPPVIVPPTPPPGTTTTLTTTTDPGASTTTTTDGSPVPVPAKG